MRRASQPHSILVEKGKSDITNGCLVRLVEFYGISINDLLPRPSDATFPEVVRRPKPALPFAQRGSTYTCSSATRAGR